VSNARLPGSWARAELSQIADVNPPRSALGASGAVAHFVPMSAVAPEFGGVDVSAIRPIGEVQKGYTAFKEGDVIFAKITPCMENGKVAVTPPLPHGVAFGSTEFHVIRPRCGASALWIAHFLSQQSIRSLARQNMTGSAGQLRVPTTWLGGLSIPLPPSMELDRIIKAVESLNHDLDQGLDALHRAKSNLDRYRASVLNSAVTGSLTAEWRKANLAKEDGKALLERILRERRERWEQEQLVSFAAKDKQPPKGWREKYEEPAAIHSYDIPDSWIWASASVVCKQIECGNTPTSELMTSGYGEVPFIKVYNLTMNGDLDFSIKPTFVSAHTHTQLLARSRAVPDDVLMNIVGPPLGKVALVPNTHPEWNMNQAVVLFRSGTAIYPKFLQYCLMSHVVSNWIERTAKATAGQANVSLTNCRLLPIPIPPLAEQEEIVKRVGIELSRADEAIQHCVLGNSQSQRLRQSILKAAFEGRLVPQDPNDEPASALLKRITAKSSAATATKTKITTRRKAAAK
jgi:type I restriction enzyme S subunit